MSASRSPPEPTTTNASGPQSARVKTALNHRSSASSVSMAWFTAVCTAPSLLWTMSMITVSGSITQTAVTSDPITSAMPHAKASVASGSRTGTTLSKPHSVNDFNSSEASVSASSLHVTPMECNRWPRVAAIASVRSTAVAARSEVCDGVECLPDTISKASRSTVEPSASCPSTRTRPTADGVTDKPSTASTLALLKPFRTSTCRGDLTRAGVSRPTGRGCEGSVHKCTSASKYAVRQDSPVSPRAVPLPALRVHLIGLRESACVASWPPWQQRDKSKAGPPDVPCSAIRSD